MQRITATTCILAGVLVASGCATKKYVRNTTTPIQAKVDQVGEQASKNAQGIEQTRGEVKQVDEKAQSGINQAQELARTADAHAADAQKSATQANEGVQKANQALQGVQQNVSQVQQQLASLDDYKMQSELSIPFKFNQYTLTPDAKKDLDNLVANVSKSKRYFIAVEGFTDRTGSVQYNEALSRRRADAVVQYLVAKHDVPIYRIHMVGLGEQKPVEDARTRAARAKNRRVEVRIFTADQTMASAGGSGNAQLQK